jgi:hypothetical protein
VTTPHRVAARDAYRTFGDLGGLVGPIVLGFVIDLEGLGTAAIVTAVIVTIVASIFALVARETVGPRAT